MSALKSFKGLLQTGWSSLIMAVKSTTTKRILLGVVFSLITTLLLFANYNPEEVDLKPGQISPFDIMAPRGAVLVDENRTAELKQQAAASVQKVYQEDANALHAAQQEIRIFYQRINDLRLLTDVDENTRLASLKSLMATELTAYPDYQEVLTEPVLKTILYSDVDTISQLSGETERLIEVLMARPLKEEDMAAAWEQAGVEVSRLKLRSEYKQLITVVLQNALRPTLILNQEATQRLVEEAENKILPVQKTVKQGQVIVRKGDPVTQEQLETLRQLGLLRTKSGWVILSGLALLVLILMGIGLIFLRQYHAEVFRNERLLLLLGLIFLISLAVARGVVAIEFSNRPEISSTVGYLIPMAAGTMLISILIDSRIGVLGTVIMSIFIGVIVGSENVAFVIVALIGGLVGVYSASQVNQGWDLAKGGILVGAVTVLVILTMGLIAYESTMATILWGTFYGLLNGLLSGILAIGALPYLETIFGITSSVRLLELANPNHPLLKRLLLETPGTYHHSLIVGSLGEAAAEVVGAQPLLVRVGAYFHDIGKLKRPYFFIENQLTGDNPHEKIAPSLSALIITSHTKDGVELARQHRLPEVVIDIINQHHGNSLVAYFYQKALENDPYDSVLESTYRYDAPKPQTKEAALVMLADSIEAAVRSLQKPTPGRVEGLVRRIIKDRLNDGQLEECDLTFKEVNLITGAFLRVLTGMHHSRIEYPDAKELERRRGKVVSASESTKLLPAPSRVGTITERNGGSDLEGEATALGNRSKSDSGG